MGRDGNPTVRRRRLGMELRQLRVAAGLSTQAAAELFETSPASVNRLETGKRDVLRVREIAAMLDVYGLRGDDPFRSRLIQLTREANEKGWWEEYDDVLTSPLGTYVGLEAEAKSLDVFETQAVHGLLQTADYARSLFSAIRPQETEMDVSRRVDLRLARQTVVERTSAPLRLRLVLDEAVLRRTIGGPAVMHDQLVHLTQAMDRPNVTVQVLTYAAGAHAGLIGPFGIFEFPDPRDPDVAYSEGPTGVAYLERAGDVDRLRKVFARLLQEAVSPSASLAIVQAAADLSESAPATGSRSGS
jgi:transcriptional regulator with XRE-family HTH domain